MQVAMDIVDRYEARGRILPRFPSKEARESAPNMELEYKDADKIKYWRNGVLSGVANHCPPELYDFLDANMPGIFIIINKLKICSFSMKCNFPQGGETRKLIASQLCQCWSNWLWRRK